MTARTKPCYACERGTVVDRDMYGDEVDYRGEPALEFDEHVIVPTCDACGERYLTSALTMRVSAVLERLRAVRKAEAVREFLREASRRHPAVPRTAWERVFGISRGYLSRLESGTRLPDTTLEILLLAYARDPEGTVRTLRAAGRLTPRLEEQLATAGT